MKNIIFLIAFALITSIAMSQNNNAVVSQNGDLNQAMVNQTGLNNTADIEQFGRNEALIDQLGVENEAIIKEGTEANPRFNYEDRSMNGGARINQEGMFNFAQTEIYNNYNGTKINQIGNGNNATQLLESKMSKTPIADDRQAVEIIQLGNLNSAEQTTTMLHGSNGIQTMWIDQNGNGNIASQQSFGGMGGEMIIDQFGSGNNSTQFQSGKDSDAHAFIEGIGNLTIQTQIYSSWSIGGANDAYIDIQGDVNIVSQNQYGEYNLSAINIAGSANDSYTGQQGDSNDALINQTGSLNGAFINQAGDLNDATITQNGIGHSGIINQMGNTNNAVINQSN